MTLWEHARRAGKSIVLGLLWASSVAGSEVVVSLDPSNTLQEIEGFGASLTDSSAWLLRYGVPPSLASNVLRTLFSPSEGIGLSVLRQPMGASDFRLQDYTYDDLPPGQTDFGLTNFSIAYDTNYIIPLLRQISVIQTNLKLIATPWSPPAWMKTSEHLYSGTLRTNAYAVLAAYFRKFIQAYAAQGLRIYAVTPQNEPLYEPLTYPGMTLSASNEIELVKAMGADFASNGIATKILVFDHNWNQYQYALTVLGNSGASAYAAGAAFHGYGGDVWAQSLVHEAHPDKDIYFTECSSGSWSGSFTNSLMWDMRNLVIGATRNWARTVIKWNLVLDQNGGPKLGGGCASCRGLLTLNTNSFAVTTNSEYYALGHASKFLKPGARRIGVEESAAGGPYTVAFLNPDTGLVAVAYNPDVEDRPFTFRCSGQSFNYVMPPFSVATFVWPDRPGATVDVWLTRSDRTELLRKETNVICLAPTSLDWKGRTWIVRDCSGEPGNNLWSASGALVDTNGWLRLAVRPGAGAWYAAGVESAESLGFGIYRWQVEGRPDLLDSNVVATFGTWFDPFRGLSADFSRAFEDAPTNFFWTVEPYYLAGHRYAGAHSLTGTLTTYEMRWAPRRVEFRAWYGHTSSPPAGAVFAQWGYEGEDVPGDTNEYVRMLLWMLEGQAPTAEQELVFADFQYEPLTGVFLADDFEDGTLSNIWERYNDPSNRITETCGELRVPPADADGDSLGIRTVSDVPWADDGFSYVFKLNLASAAVTRARSGGGPDIWAYQALVRGGAGSLDPIAASNAASLRAGYDASEDQLFVEFLTKTNAPGSWGSSRFVGRVDNASSFFGSTGLDLCFTLVYSNYEIAVTHGGSPVGMTVVSGASTGAHHLGKALYAARYVAGAQNHNDGRGTIYLGSVERQVRAVLPSKAGGAEEEGYGSTVIQIGTADPGNTWRVPIDTTYRRHRAMALYRSDDIGWSGTITQLWIHVLSAPEIPLSNYTVRLQHTSSNRVGTTFVNTGWTTVHCSHVTIPSGFAGWYALPFAQPFVYDARSNLLVDFVIYNTDRDSSPVPAATYTPSTYTSCLAACADTGDPFSWSSLPTGSRTYKFRGARLIDLRLAFVTPPPMPLGSNLSFEAGPPGFLTNVPAWRVDGSEFAGAVKAGPSLHGIQSLKLWKNGSEGYQKVYQPFAFSLTNAYVLSGYLLTESGDPLEGAGSYGAFRFEWYGPSGLIRADESERFTPGSTPNVWHLFSVTGVPPWGATSGRFACVLISSADQKGSVYFDRLELRAEASPQAGSEPIPVVRFLEDDFNDTVRSNCWDLTGDWSGAEFQEANGLLRVRPGTNSWQSSGYVTAQPIGWDNTSAWYVFSAVLATVRVDAASGTNDIEILLGVCSAKDNPWWVTNSCGLYGYYDATADRLIVQFLTKTNAPAQSGAERFNATFENISRILDGTNALRISLALGFGEYDLRFSDRQGIPVPYTLNAGTPRGPHYLGDRLTNAHWLVGAQADWTKRGNVFWDETRVYRTHAPAVTLLSAAQTSTNGGGLVTLSHAVVDPNGDPCRLRIEASTNGGASWFWICASAITSSLPAALAPTQRQVQVVSIATTNAAGYAVSNLVAVEWPTLPAGLGGLTLTNVRVRVRVDDGDVGPPPVTSAVFGVDNQGPAATAATVTVENDADWTFNTNLFATWSGFTDAGSAIRGYYVSLTNLSAPPFGAWTASPPALVNGAVLDALNTVYVRAEDAFGNVGAAASDALVVLSATGDYDADDLPNTNELAAGTDPLNADSDGDEMADGWEVAYGLNPTNGGDRLLDPDEDGYENRGEYYCDTDPHDAASSLRFGARASGVAGQFLLEWYASPERRYTLRTRSGWSSEWAEVEGWVDRIGVGGLMTYTGSTAEADSGFFRLRVSLP